MFELNKKIAISTTILGNSIYGMNTDIKKSDKLEKNNDTTSKLLTKLKNKYILKGVFGNLNEGRSLKIYKYNKEIQRRLNLKLNDYKDYSKKIVLEIITSNGKYGKFININEKNRKYCHIYFNDSNEEIISKYDLNQVDDVKKIKIIIDCKVRSFKSLFYKCECIESINFIKFYRDDIMNMSFMFYGCNSLEKINLSKFNTNNVTNMSYMFDRCSSLKELNLSSFNTNNVTDMCYMFFKCSSLEKLNLSSFNTNNVQDMSSMFDRCSSLKELNLSSFNTNNVTDMSYMFHGCSSLISLNLSSFNTNNVTNMNSMFDGCSSLKD